MAMFKPCRWPKVRSRNLTFGPAILRGLLIPGLLFLAATGCKKKADEAPVSPALTNQAIAAGVNAPAAPPDVAEITRQLRRWILKNQRPPKNFEDFAATTTYQIPPPPPGKKYTIDRQMHVLLVDR